MSEETYGVEGQPQKKKIRVKRKGLLHRLAETPEKQTIDYGNTETCKIIGKNAVDNPLVKPDIVEDLGNMFDFPLSFAISRRNKAVEANDRERITRFGSQVIEMQSCKETAIDAAQKKIEKKEAGK